MGAGGGAATDHGLIIQGVLILLSAVVGCIGYIIQSRLKRSAEARIHQQEAKQARFQQQLKRDDALRARRLEHLYTIREKILSPIIAQNDAATFIWAQWIQHTLQSPPDYSKNAILLQNDDTNPKPSLVSAFACICPKFHAHFMAGEYYGQWTLTSDGVAEQMKADPNGKVAVSYRRMVKMIVEQYYVPVSKLLTEKMNVLDLPSNDEFKQRYPCYASDVVWLRKHMFLEMVAWSTEMADIIKEEWDKGDVSQLHTRYCPFPMMLGMYLANFLTKIKLEISELEDGLVSHNVVDDTKLSSQELQEIEKEFSTPQRSVDDSERKQREQQGNHAKPNSKGRYVVAAVAGAAASAATSFAVSN